MESGKGQAEKQEKRDGFDNIPKYNVSIISDGTADREKEHEGSAAGAPHLPRSNCVSWACIARNPPPERSNPLNGENLIYQVQELRRNPLRSCAVPVGSRNFVPRPLAVEPPTGGKNMRAPRQVRVTCTMILKDGKPVCRGAGDSHLPRSLRARSPHVLFPVGGSNR